MNLANVNLYIKIIWKLNNIELDREVCEKIWSFFLNKMDWYIWQTSFEEKKRNFWRSENDESWGPPHTSNFDTKYLNIKSVG
jgi:hypothetical protein